MDAARSLQPTTFVPTTSFLLTNFRLISTIEDLGYSIYLCLSRLPQIQPSKLLHFPYFEYLFDQNYISHSVSVALDHSPHLGTGEINITNEDAMGGFDSNLEMTPLDYDLSDPEKSLGRYTITLSQL